jgi:hypothetical protein
MWFPRFPKTHPRRLVGTQFPPWTEGTDVWGVQHLTHPELQEKTFAEWYGSPKLLEAVCQLLHTKPEDLQLGKKEFVDKTRSKTDMIFVCRIV